MPTYSGVGDGSQEARAAHQIHESLLCQSWSQSHSQGHAGFRPATLGGEYDTD